MGDSGFQRPPFRVYLFTLSPNICPDRPRPPPSHQPYLGHTSLFCCVGVKLWNQSCPPSACAPPGFLVSKVQEATSSEWQTEHVEKYPSAIATRPDQSGSDRKEHLRMRSLFSVELWWQNTDTSGSTRTYLALKSREDVRAPGRNVSRSILKVNRDPFAHLFEKI